MTTGHQLSTICAASLLAIAIGGTPLSARAESQADLGQMMSAIKRLEARVSALEVENKALRQKAGAASSSVRAIPSQTQANRESKVARSAPNLHSPPPSDALASAAPALAQGPAWNGLYAGAAFGLGFLRGAATESTVDNFNDSLFQSSSGTFTQITNTTTNTTSTRDGRSAGAIGNLFLGYNFLATNNIVLGAQVEGGVSNVHVTMNGSGTSVATTNRFAQLGGSSPSITNPSATSTNNFSKSDALANRWMVSLLGRGGVLIDPADFVYVLGGYTYGRFEAFNTSFGMNGATIGGGWERELAPGWTLRGEYRYTKFAGKDVTSSSTASTASATDFFGTPPSAHTTETTLDNQSTTNHVSADMHSVWLGVAHYFNP